MTSIKEEVRQKAKTWINEKLTLEAIHELMDSYIKQIDDLEDDRCTDLCKQLGMGIFFDKDTGEFEDLTVDIEDQLDNHLFDHKNAFYVKYSMCPHFGAEEYDDIISELIWQVEH